MSLAFCGRCSRVRNRACRQIWPQKEYLSHFCDNCGAFGDEGLEGLLGALLLGEDGSFEVCELGIDPADVGEIEAPLEDSAATGGLA